MRLDSTQHGSFLKLQPNSSSRTPPAELLQQNSSSLFQSSPISQHNAFSGGAKQSSQEASSQHRAVRKQSAQSSEVKVSTEQSGSSQHRAARKPVRPVSLSSDSNSVSLGLL
ncbi:unnamed protein product [Merluccius merluccius]